MERDQGAALRRVAIVLSSLPDATARRLLASLESDQQRAVRGAIAMLDDVDPLERRRALDGFSHSIRQGRPALAGENDAAQIVLSPVALHRHDPQPASRVETRGATAAGGPAGQQSAFEFLRTIDDTTIAHRIAEEHPQTVAIILASISPRQAAKLLAKLGVGLRAEAMRRLAKLETPPQELVEEVAEQLRKKLLHHLPGDGHGLASAHSQISHSHIHGSTDAVPANPPRSVGQAALQAIMAEINHGASRLDGPTGVGQPAGLGRPAFPASEYHASLAANAGIAPAMSGRPSGDQVVFRDSRSPQTDAVARRETDPGKHRQSTAEIHSQLISMPPESLREALASVDGRLAILALCGLPQATAEAVLKGLPRRQAKQIRQQITSLGMLELREIDAAKAAVAAAARMPANRSSIPISPRAPVAAPTASLAAA